MISPLFNNISMFQPFLKYITSFHDLVFQITLSSSQKSQNHNISNFTIQQFTNSIFLHLPFHFFLLSLLHRMQRLIEWIEAHQLPCYYKKFLGLECLGCGMQTALLFLLKGQFIESFKAFPAMIPVIVLIFYLLLHLIFKFRNGARILKIWLIFTVTIMIASYLFKLFTI